MILVAVAVVVVPIHSYSKYKGLYMSNITLSANQGAGTYTVTGTAQTQNGPLIQTIFIDVPTIQIAHSDAYIAPPPTHNDTPRPVCYDRVAVLSAFGDTPDMACSMPAQYNYYIANNNFIYADENCSDFSNAYGYISDNGGMWFHVRGGRIVGRGACVAPQTTQPTGVSSGTPSGAGHSDTYGQNNDMMI
jgi:hypothetical protein